MSDPIDIRLNRAYQAPADEDGKRYLVDRIWPRGVSRETLQITDWLKEISPTDGLRKWFGHAPERWQIFHQKYTAELRSHHEQLAILATEAHQHRITLVYGAKDEKHNQAIVIRDYLNTLALADIH